MPKKFQPPRGMRDFGPEEMFKRNYMLERIRTVFEKFGFQPLETPAVESWKLLSRKGSGGEEIKKEIYYFKDKGDRELGLRFDLTVPLARFVASNPQLKKPFKRYQIGRVWRYDRPQAGRYREFWQSDVDIVGSERMECEAECLKVAVECLKELGFENFKIRVNNRKILNGLVEDLGIEKSKSKEVFRSLDKLEKTGKKEVKKELKQKKISEKKIEKLLKLTETSGGKEVLEKIKIKRKTGKEGKEELKQLVEELKAYQIDELVELDFSLVRGLDYYTGTIFEIVVEDGDVGSVAGGGRYDELIGLYGGKDSPAVGISLGIERLYQVMEDRKMFQLGNPGTEVFIVTVENRFRNKALEITNELRSENIKTEVDLMGRGLRKQLDYVNRSDIPKAVIVGEKEVETGKYTLKDMESGKEKKVSLKKMVKELEKPKEF